MFVSGDKRGQNVPKAPYMGLSELSNLSPVFLSRGQLFLNILYKGEKEVVHLPDVLRHKTAEKKEKKPPKKKECTRHLSREARGASRGPVKPAACDKTKACVVNAFSFPKGLSFFLFLPVDATHPQPAKHETALKLVPRPASALSGSAFRHVCKFLFKNDKGYGDCVVPGKSARCRPRAFYMHKRHFFLQLFNCRCPLLSRYRLFLRG